MCRALGVAALASVASAIAVGASAGSSPQAVCGTRNEGNWIVRSYSFAPVTAADERYAKRYLGRTVRVSKSVVEFGMKTCKIRDVDTDSLSDDERGYPLRIEYNCADAIVSPVFYVGSSCGQILASLDGVTFRLGRARSRDLSHPARQ